MPDKAYFVSDLHLGSSTEPNSLVFLEFLKSFQTTEHITHLFLVGDIFDLWIGQYNYFIFKYAPIVRELTRLVKMGVQVHYFEGNHDLYLKHFFGKKLGIKIHEGPALFELAGLKIRVEHGDQMDPTDKGYIFLRKFLRTRLMNWLAIRLPEDWVIALGEKMSSMSRVYTSKLKTISTTRARGVIKSHAERVLATGKVFDIIISGHVHVVEDIKINFRMGRQIFEPRIVNLGAWFDEPRVFVIDNQEQRFLDLK